MFTKPLSKHGGGSLKKFLNFYLFFIKLPHLATEIKGSATEGLVPDTIAYILV